MDNSNGMYNKEKPMNQETFLSTREAAAYCQVNFKTVLKWIVEGRLKSYQLPGSGVNRIKVRDFLLFLKESDLPVPPELVSLGKIRLLIVDDEPSSISMMRRLFRSSEFIIESAGDGFEAGRKLESFHPDIILLDLRMPGMSGEEVLRQIKSNPQTRAIRVIILSGHVDDEMSSSLMKAGAEGVLTKPADRAELLKIIGIRTKKDVTV